MNIVVVLKASSSMSSFNPHVLPVAGKGFAVNVHGPHRPQRVSAMGSNAYTKLFL